MNLEILLEIRNVHLKFELPPPALPTDTLAQQAHLVKVAVRHFLVHFFPQGPTQGQN